MLTLQEFASRFIDGYAKANRQKPSGIAAKQTILDVHLIPALGIRKLDAITNEDVQRLKQQLREKAPNTVNNMLAVLSVLLKKAVEWDVIDRMPCTIRLLPISKTSMGFYDFDEYERLIEAAKALNPVAHVIVLLGGESDPQTKLDRGYEDYLEGRISDTLWAWKSEDVELFVRPTLSRSTFCH